MSILSDPINLNTHSTSVFGRFKADRRETFEGKSFEDQSGDEGFISSTHLTMPLYSSM